MEEEVIVEQKCKCGSTEKIWNDNKGRYDCLQCGKKWKMIQKTGYKGTGKKIRVLKWIRNFFKGKL
jgi:hypothetical protein